MNSLHSPNPVIGGCDQGLCILAIVVISLGAYAWLELAALVDSKSCLRKRKLREIT